jgi:hypothetical protein
MGRVPTRLGTGVVVGVDGVLLRVLPEADSDSQELAEWADDLLVELAEVDEASVAPLSADTAPDGAKGLGVLAGQLLAQVTTISGLRAVVSAVRAWAARRQRTVEISIGGDVLKMSGVSSQQQEKIIDAWTVRHATIG